MSTQPTPDDASNTIKDPDTWTTGGEPATGAQLSYLKTLMGEAKQEFDETKEITKSDASKLIEELRAGNARVQEEGEPSHASSEGAHTSTSGGKGA